MNSSRAQRWSRAWASASSVCCNCCRTTPSRWATITLRDALSDFPHLWQQLIKAVGAPLTELATATPQGRAGTDLQHLQQHLLQNTAEKIRLRGDGTVIALRADSPQESTPLTALLTQSWLAQAPQQTIALLAEARGELLDDTLEHLHSPRLGFSALSPWRPVFQVLPLACELLWEPLNPTALFQFLSHPVGPIPGRIRATLAQTVANTPGIGSAAWEEAITASLESEDKAETQETGTKHSLLAAVAAFFAAQRRGQQDPVRARAQGRRLVAKLQGSER